MIQRILSFLHRLTKTNCKHCRHCYTRNECDINIGLWAGRGYCSKFEREEE